MFIFKVGTIYITLSIPQDIVMDLKNVMLSLCDKWSACHYVNWRYDGYPCVGHGCKGQLHRMYNVVWYWNWCAMLIRVAFMVCHVALNVPCHFLWLSPNDCKIIQLVSWWGIVRATLNHVESVVCSVYVWQIAFDVQLQVRIVTWRCQKQEQMLN